MSGSAPGVAIPAPRTFLARLVKAVIAAEPRGQSGFVIGRPAEPAIGQPRPFGDRIAARQRGQRPNTARLNSDE